MKANIPLLFGIAILWVASLFGTYQVGHRSGTAEAPERQQSGLSADPSGRSIQSSRSQRRSSDEQLTVKQVFSQLKARMRPGSMQNPVAMMRMMALLDKLDIDDIPEALAEAEAMDDQQAKMLVYMALLGKWGEHDGPAAMKYAEEHSKELGMAGSVAMMSAASSWAEYDPEAVWAWYQENQDDSSGMSGGNPMGNQMVLASIFSNLMRSDPDAAFERLGELDQSGKTMALSGMTQAALFDPDQRKMMLAKIEAMDDEGMRTSARQMLLSQWVIFEPEEVATWVGQQPAGEQAELRQSLGGGLFMTNPQKGVEFIMEGATEEEKPQRMTKVIDSWVYHDPEAASAWLEKQGGGPELDQARRSLVLGISSRDPVAAMQEIQTISDPDERFNTASAVYQSWSARDAKAADQALEETGLTPGEIETIRSGSTKDVPEIEGGHSLKALETEEEQ